MAVKSILMVCRGNICRSPMAEGFFAHQLRANHPSVTISSAGISALVDYPADINAQAVLEKNGMSIAEHRARQISESLVRAADLILVMSKSHLDTVVRQFMSAKGKCFLLGHWQGFEIQDPFKQPYEMFEKAYQQMDLAWQDWKKRI